MVRKALLALLVCLLLGLITDSIVFAQAPEPKLTLGFEQSAKVGSDIVFAAYLNDPAGNPIRGEQITFYIDASFMNVSQDINIGTATTDDNGLAVLRYTPKQDGDHVLKAAFAGNSVFAATETSSPLTISPGPATYTETSPFRMPGANIIMVAIVLLAVWGTYFFVILQFWRISADKGAKKPEGEMRK